MILHHAFFEALGSTEAGSPQWDSLFAGLVTMRLLDRAAEGADATIPSGDWGERDRTRARAEAMSAGNPVRAVLLRILDASAASTILSPELGASLLSYGRALDIQGRWTLAADVFQTITDSFSERLYPRIVIEAATALGASARNTGDWETSNRAYARAEHLAESIGDRALSLTARVGLATSQMIRGNLPAADAELEQVLDEANAAGFTTVQAIALHACASVAHSRGDFNKAIHVGYRSLELTTNSSARERLLADISAAYAELGMLETARDGYSIVAMTSPHQWVRWQATLNLMELAIKDADEGSFDNYVAQLEGAALEPRLLTYFLYFRALGSRRFSRSDEHALFAAAQSSAESNQLHQLAFEIEAAKLTDSVPEEIAGIATAAEGEAAAELLRIAEVLGHLRDTQQADEGTLLRDQR
ncbi:MAG: hypothetical protein ACSLFK_08275 [Gemmatimonadaceae bacterium]